VRSGSAGRYRRADVAGDNHIPILAPPLREIAAEQAF